MYYQFFNWHTFRSKCVSEVACQKDFVKNKQKRFTSMQNKEKKNFTCMRKF